jgi:hypothetical protein
MSRIRSIRPSFVVEARSWPVVTSGPCRLHYLIRPIAAVVSRWRDVLADSFHPAAESVGDPHPHKNGDRHREDSKSVPLLVW